MTAVVGLVPARGRSKGVARKNVRDLAGRPLLDYTARAARESGVLDRVVLSTEDTEIAEVGRRVGLEVAFMRPPELAADDTPMLPVVQHAIRELEGAGAYVGWIVVLQATSPLRRPADVAAAVGMARETGCDSVVGVAELPRHLSPDYVMRIDDRGALVPFLERGAAIGRRQDARPAYVRDGSVYVVRRDVAMDQGSLYGEDCRPLLVDPSTSLSIDSPDDWAEAERRLASSASSEQP